MKAKLFKEIYELLTAYFGYQGWWPAETPFEVCVGAILTQNTNWTNVEKAIRALKEKGMLSPENIYQLQPTTLANLIKPCGFYNLKAKRLKNFINFLMENYEGNLEKMKIEDLDVLREKLLKVNGLGKETVDSILLYALEKPIFVIDAYTYRILNRHGIVPEEATYDEIQELFHSSLDRDVELYKEYHAQLVACGKSFCKKTKPLCAECPLKVLF